MAGNGLKRIFISDLHMNTDESEDPPSGNKYGWIGTERIKALASFVSQIPKMGDVEDVVILGDMCDNWVCPAQRDPAHFLDDILKAGCNESVFSAFHNLPSEVKVHYVHGNHDMLMEGGDLTQQVPNITVLGTGEQPGRFIDDKLVAEHGHRYCVFNCPEQLMPGASILPSGFPVTRFFADHVYRTGEDPGYWEIIVEVLKDVLEDHHETLVKEFLHGMANACGLNNDSEVWCGGLLNYPNRVTVKQFEERYKDDYTNWPERTQTRVGRLGALFNDAGEWGGNLELGAYEQYLAPQEADIVIFGHTHHKMLHARAADEITLGEPIQPSRWIYANSGTWIDKANLATYVETEKDLSAGLHWVRLCGVDDKGNPLSEPLSKACVKL
ncbi:MAG: hypothetical protein GY906_26040 [bacterium]|nr:hypothetical protein [bacterium]